MGRQKNFFKRLKAAYDKRQRHLAVKREKEGKMTKKQEEKYWKERWDRKRKQAIELMGGPPPYTLGSKVANQAVAVIEAELLNKQTLNCGSVSIDFNYHVRTLNGENAPPIPIPEWPTKWPANKESLVFYWGRLAAEQIYAAFCAKHPDWKELDPDANWSRDPDFSYPAICLYANNYPGIRFYWGDDV